MNPTIDEGQGADPRPRSRSLVERLPLLAALALLCLTAIVNRDNDGLWYQGDSPRHALNGVFWKDFLASGEYLSAKEYAFDYYRTYPAITPTIWPPFLYWCEAALYGVFGVHAEVARLLVLAFAALFLIYLHAFLRTIGVRSLGRWAMLLAVAQPGFYLWSNAVMLDMPALALGIAAVYHFHRGIGEERRRHLLLGAAFSVAAFWTRPTGVVLPFAYVVACLCSGDARRRLFRTDAILTAAVSLVLAAPWIFVQMRWGAIVTREATGIAGATRWSLGNWTYYMRTMGTNLHLWYSLLVILGLACAIAVRASRRTAIRATLALAVLLLSYSYFSLKEARYVVAALPFGAVLIGLGANRLQDALQRVPWSRAAAPIVLAAVSCALLVPADVPQVKGLDAVLADVVQRHPGERILYDGMYDGNFVFYHRAHPQRDAIRVLRGGKVFYATALNKRFGLEEFVKNAADIRARVGDVACRYLLIEREEVVGVEPARILRETVAADGMFKLVRSYPVETTHLHVPTGNLGKVTTLDLYEYLGELRDPPDESIAFPALGD